MVFFFKTVKLRSLKSQEISDFFRQAEDIHKLREYNYYQMKDISRQERIDYYNTDGMDVHKEIQARKLQNIN